MRKSGGYFNSALKLLLIILVGCNSTKPIAQVNADTTVVILKAPLYITDSAGKIYAIQDTNNVLKVFDSAGTIKILLNAVNRLDKCSLQTK